MTENLDKISAEIGFLACDVLKETYNVFVKEVKTFKNFSELKAKKSEVINKIKEELKINDFNLTKEIFEKIIIENIEKIKNNKKQEEKFFKLKQNPPKFDAKELERVVTKALGILIEDGAFAYTVWLESEGGDIHKVISIASVKLLDKASVTSKKESLREAILEISKNIQKTLLARQILERMLVYARYRAKALQKGD